MSVHDKILKKSFSIPLMGPCVMFLKVVHIMGGLGLRFKLEIYYVEYKFEIYYVDFSI